LGKEEVIGMRDRIVLGMLLFCMGLLAAVQPAKADSMDGVTFTVTNPNQSAGPGALFTWMYTLTNSNPDGLNVFFADLSAPFGFNATDGTPGNAFDNFGGSNIVDHGASFSGTLFSFQSFTNVPNSNNSGFFDLTLILLDNQGNFVDLIDLTDNYSATVTSSTNVPEPGILLLLASGLLAGLLLSRRGAH
jgi:hypothetical protein